MRIYKNAAQSLIISLFDVDFGTSCDKNRVVRRYFFGFNTFIIIIHFAVLKYTKRLVCRLSMTHDLQHYSNLLNLYFSSNSKRTWHSNCSRIILQHTASKNWTQNQTSRILYPARMIRSGNMLQPRTRQDLV